MNKKIQNVEIYQKLVDSIGNTIESAQQRAIQQKQYLFNEAILPEISNFPVADWKIDLDSLC